MRPAAFTASLLLHAGVLCAVGAWRVKAPASPRAGDGTAAAEFSFFAAELPAPADTTDEVVALVEFTPPPQPLVVPVETAITPIVNTAAEAVAVTPSAIVSAVPIAVRKSAKRFTTRTGGGLTGGGGSASYQPPRYRVCPAPAYPALARAQKLEGAALLLVVVDAAGHPTRVTLRRSTGSAVLDDAAVRAVWKWQFEPARTDGHTIAASVEVPVRFLYRG